MKLKVLRFLFFLVYLSLLLCLVWSPSGFAAERKRKRERPTTQHNTIHLSILSWIKRGKDKMLRGVFFMIRDRFFLTVDLFVIVDVAED